LYRFTPNYRRYFKNLPQGFVNVFLKKLSLHKRAVKYLNMHEDQRYIDGLKTSNHQIVKEIYSNYSTQIEKLVLKNSGSSEDSKDLFQEGLVAIFDLATKKDFKLTCPFGALLYRICYNKWIDKLREKKKLNEVSLSDESGYTYEASQKDALALAEEAEEKHEQFQQLEQAFQQLSELCQSLLEMFKKNIKPNEIAKQLGMDKVSTYYRRKNACMERWKKLIYTA